MYNTDEEVLHFDDIESLLKYIDSKEKEVEETINYSDIFKDEIFN